MNRRDVVTRLMLALTLPPSLYICSASAQIIEREDNNPSGLVLTKAQVSLLGKLCEAILPATDTAGARDARVHDFIAGLFSDWMTESEQARFERGMREIGSRLGKAAGKSPRTISDSEMMGLVMEESKVLERSEETEYQVFFRQLRALTIIGYYTSEIGQQQDLQVQFGAGQDTAAGPVVAKAYSL